MHIPPCRLGFDIDGVVADTTETFIRLAREDYSIMVRPEEITDFMVENCLPMPPHVIAEIFERLLNNPLEVDLKPIRDSVSVLTKLAETAPLTFITARPDPKPISSWLEKHLGQETFAPARLIATGDHDGKAAPIKRLGLNYFIDDRHLTCNQLASEPGITPIVYSQPWNRGRHLLNSVENWADIQKLCTPS
jgi:uncharacterized HAD superfamily protein